MKTLFLEIYSFSLIILFTFLFPSYSSAQEINPTLLKDLSTKAQVVMEGEIISQDQCIMDGIPYRVFELRPFKIFKGTIEGNITLIQIGGMIDSTLFMSFHDPYLKSGVQGIYFLAETNESKLPCLGLKEQFTLLDVAQYFDDGINPQVVIADQKTNNYERFIKSIVEDGNRPKVLESSMHEKRMGVELFEGSPSNTQPFVMDETLIEYSFENPFYDFASKIFSFDVHAKLTGENITFGEGSITINYDTLILGSNLVSKGLVNVTKGNDIIGSTYTLSTTDYSPSAIQVDVTGPCDPSAPSLPGGKAPKDLHLFHFESSDPPISLETPISFDKFSMTDQSQYIDDQGDCHPFDTYVIDDPIIYVENNGGVGICLILDNYSYEDVGSKKFLNFSLFARQEGTLPGNVIYFGGSTIHVDYSDAAFGTNVVAGMKLSAVAAGFTDPNYQLTITDVSLTTFEIKIQRATLFPYLEMTSGALHKMGDFTLEVVSCLNFAGINPLLPTAIPSGFVAAAPGIDPIINGTPMAYAPQTAKGTYNGLTCDPKMRIDNFTQNVPAGDNEESRIIIQGFGFNNGILPGNNPIGKVYFPNADNGGASYTYTHVTDIEKWSDSEIILYVPSVIGDDCPNVTGQELIEKGASGSGKFIIEAPDNNGLIDRIESQSDLNIPYSIINFRNAQLDNCGAIRLHLTKDNANPYNNEGYKFNVSNITNTGDPNLINCMADIFCEWNAVNDIQFVMSATLSNNPAENPFLISDDINGVTYNTFLGTGSTLAATKIVGMNRNNTTDINCLGNGFFKERMLVTVSEIDIIINQNNFPNLDCVNDPLLQQTLRHEIGHAFTLNHTLPENQLMSFSASNSNPIGIGANEIFGSVDAADNSQELNAGCADQPIVTGILTSCLTVSTSNLNSYDKLNIFPSILELSKSINLTIEGDTNEINKVLIYNSLGILIPSSYKIYSPKLILTLEQFLSPGLYYLQFYEGSKLIQSHKIILQ